MLVDKAMLRQIPGCVRIAEGNRDFQWNQSIGAKINILFLHYTLVILPIKNMKMVSIATCTKISALLHLK